MQKPILISSMLLCLLLVGCQRQISGSVYHGRAVGASSKTYEGTVVSMRFVMVQEDEMLQDNVAGGAMGAIAGGVLGHQMGKGSGKDAATVIGALAGAVGGAAAERSLKQQEAVEYTVRLSSGDLRTIVQGKEPLLYKGQDVYLIVTDGDRARLIPR